MVCINDLTRILDLVIKISTMIRPCLERRDALTKAAEDFLDRREIDKAKRCITQARAYSLIAMRLHRTVENLFRAEEEFRVGNSD